MFVLFLRGAVRRHEGIYGARGRTRSNNRVAVRGRA